MFGKKQPQPKRVEVPQPVYVWVRTLTQHSRFEWSWVVEHKDKQRDTQFYQKDYTRYARSSGYTYTKGLAKFFSQIDMNRWNRKFAYVTEVEVIEDA